MSIEINLSRQTLHLRDPDQAEVVYRVSTSRYGPGENSGSFCTPRGRHRIRVMIGAGLPQAAVFSGRRVTSEIHCDALAKSYPARDWILTRILWLSGQEPGRNRLGKVDTMRRYIYIHGMPDTEPVGTPFSHGCIRMRNTDVIRLFDQVAIGTPVDIIP